MTDKAHQQVNDALDQQKALLDARKAFSDTLSDVRATLRLLKMQMGMSPAQLAIANIGKGGTVTRPAAVDLQTLKANSGSGGHADAESGQSSFETKRLNAGQFDQAAYRQQILAWVKARDYEINDRTGTVIFAGGKAFMDLTHFRANYPKG